MSLIDLSSFDAHGNLHVIVESPRGSKLKLKYEPKQAMFTLSRPLPLGVAYPYDWGFVPSTCAPDGDPLDAMVVWDETSYPGLLLTCRTIGALVVEQNSKHDVAVRERNNRVIAVPVDAPRLEPIHSVNDLPTRVREEIEAFFLASTAFEHKHLKLLGWSQPDAAIEMIRAARQPSGARQDER
jgi:inorganic pyrophosphatase